MLDLQTVDVGASSERVLSQDREVDYRVQFVYSRQMNKIKIGTVIRNEFWAKASKMPGLSHWPDRAKKYDVKDSQVSKWLLDQPESLEWIFQKARSLGVIVFDPETKLWHGVSTAEGTRLVIEGDHDGSSS